MKHATSLLLIGIALVTFFIGGAPCSAEELQIKNMTPEGQQALDNRRNRYAALQNVKAQGAVGENNHGYLATFTEAHNAGALAEAENRDRAIIYQLIAQQNNIADRTVVEQVFANVQRTKAQPGEKIQNDDGSWGVK